MKITDKDITDIFERFGYIANVRNNTSYEIETSQLCHIVKELIAQKIGRLVIDGKASLVFENPESERGTQ